jgi:hypothetical protein
MPRNRFQNAIAIQGGACNPRAIVNTLIAAISEMDKETRGSGRFVADTDTITGDAAFRLMVHQLAYITRAYRFDHLVSDYDAALSECQKKAGEWS